MDKLIKPPNLRSKLALECNEYVDNVYQRSESGFTNFTISISDSRTRVMHTGVNRKTTESHVVRVAEFKYLGCVFSEDDKLENRKFEHN